MHQDRPADGTAGNILNCGLPDARANRAEPSRAEPRELNDPSRFHSFHYDLDVQRAAQVKNMGAVEGKPILSSKEWEDVKAGGDRAIRAWIAEQMAGKSCSVVLIGTQTAGRPCIEYEFTKAWNDGKGVLGVHIHNLKDLAGNQSRKGANPFAGKVAGTGSSAVRLGLVVPVVDPPFRGSTEVYAHIRDNLATWVDQAVGVRVRY